MKLISLVSSFTVYKGILITQVLLMSISWTSYFLFKYPNYCLGSVQL